MSENAQQTQPSYTMTNEVDDVDDTTVIDTFLTPMTGRGEMPKGQHPEVRAKANQFIYNMDAFTYDGNKIWVDQCQNPATPEWLQGFDWERHAWSSSDVQTRNLSVDGEFEINSHIEYHSSFDHIESGNGLALGMLGCSEMALRQQHLDNGYDPAKHWYSLLDPVWQTIFNKVEYDAREWTHGSERTLKLTVVQVMGFDDDTNTVYGRIFQPDGASDSEHLCREGITQKAILSFPFSNPDGVSRGDIIIVWTDRWISADSRVFDAVNLSNHPPPSHISAKARDWLTHDAITPIAFETDMVNLANPDAIKPPRYYGTGMALEVGDITPTHMIHPSRNNAFGFWMASKLYSELCVSGDITTLPVSESIPDMFIPAFRDKRGQKIIDLASPFFPHYHDEIRCPTCNGRVLIKARPDNKQTKATCPHCKTKDAILFPHLTPTNTVKGVGHDE